MKIRPVEADLFHAEDAQMTKLIVAFRNFANVSKNELKTGSTFRYAAAPIACLLGLNRYRKPRLG